MRCPGDLGKWRFSLLLGAVFFFIGPQLLFARTTPARPTNLRLAGPNPQPGGGPLITGVSGTLTHRSEVKISGRNFGAHADYGGAGSPYLCAAWHGFDDGKESGGNWTFSNNGYPQQWALIPSGRTGRGYTLRRNNSMAPWAKSRSAVAMGKGMKSFALSEKSATTPISTSGPLVLARSISTGKWMQGPCTSNDGTTLVLNITETYGSGTCDDWYFTHLLGGPWEYGGVSYLQTITPPLGKWFTSQWFRRSSLPCSAGKHQRHYGYSDIYFAVDNGEDVSFTVIREIPIPPASGNGNAYTGVVGKAETWMRLDTKLCSLPGQDLYLFRVNNAVKMFRGTWTLPGPLTRSVYELPPYVTEEESRPGTRWVPDNWATANHTIDNLSQMSIRQEVEGWWEGDDMFVNFTWARVELGNQPVYADCTHLEIQPPKAWTSGEITIDLNQGSFPPGPAYLFVINEEEVASPGRLVILE